MKCLSWTRSSYFIEDKKIKTKYQLVPLEVEIVEKIDSALTVLSVNDLGEGYLNTSGETVQLKGRSLSTPFCN